MNKKRAVKLLLIIIVSSLLLTGCADIESLDTYNSWRDAFRIGISAEMMMAAFKVALSFLSLCIAAHSLFTLPKQAFSGVHLLNTAAAGAIVTFLTTLLLLFMFDLADTITNVMLPQDLTLEVITQHLDIEFSLDKIMEAIVRQWAIQATSKLPILIKIALKVSFVIVLVIYAIDILRGTHTAFWALIGVLGGHYIFLSIFLFTLETQSGVLLEEWSQDPSSIEFSILGYLLIVSIALILCYFAIPGSVVIFAPNLVGPKSVYWEKETISPVTNPANNSNQSKKVAKVDPSTLVIPIGVQTSNTNKNQNVNATAVGVNVGTSEDPEQPFLTSSSISNQNWRWVDENGEIQQDPFPGQVPPNTWQRKGQELTKEVEVEVSKIPDLDEIQSVDIPKTNNTPESIPPINLEETTEYSEKIPDVEVNNTVTGNDEKVTNNTESKAPEGTRHQIPQVEVPETKETPKREQDTWSKPSNPKSKEDPNKLPDNWSELEL